MSQLNLLFSELLSGKKVYITLCKQRKIEAFLEQLEQLLTHMHCFFKVRRSRAGSIMERFCLCVRYIIFFYFILMFTYYITVSFYSDFVSMN